MAHLYWIVKDLQNCLGRTVYHDVLCIKFTYRLPIVLGLLVALITLIRLRVALLRAVATATVSH